jgi:small GTP-binding protein
VILGDSRVGKTSLIDREFHEFEPSTPMPTVGCECTDFRFTIGGKPFTLQVWDTAGQEVYRALVPVYLHAAAGVIIVYDITCRESFDSLAYWLELVEHTLPKDAVRFLVGNKLDLAERTAIAQEDAMVYANDHHATFFNASAITGQGVDEIFRGMATELAPHEMNDSSAVENLTEAVPTRSCEC